MTIAICCLSAASAASAVQPIPADAHPESRRGSTRADPHSRSSAARRAVRGDDDAAVARVGGSVCGLRERCGRALPNGAVLFTFDDAFVREWVAAMPIFRRFDARATFFVTGPDRLTPDQLAGLGRLAKAGHAIGCHGLRHRKAVDFTRENGIEAYLEKEIRPANRVLREAGFHLSAFAYPSSQNSRETDAALLKIFRHLRTGTGLKKNQRLRDLDRIFVPAANVGATGCLIGTGIDYAGTPKRPDYVEQVCEALDRARKNAEVVVFYAHNISDHGPGHHLSPEALKAILAHARAIGLPAISYDELP